MLITLHVTTPSWQRAPAHRGGSARRSTTAGTIYGMKTTLYLPDDIKRAVEVEARRRGVSEAEVVRDALRSTLVKTRIEPRGALFHGREPIADRVDELLAEGFGQ